MIFGRVEGVDRHAGLFIDIIGDPDTRLGGAADTMLRRQQRHELQVVVLRDQINVRRARPVDPRVIGDETNPLAPQRRRQIGEEDLDAGAYGLLGAETYGHRVGCLCRRGAG